MNYVLINEGVPLIIENMGENFRFGRVVEKTKKGWYANV